MRSATIASPRFSGLLIVNASRVVGADIVTDADGEQLDRGPALDLADDSAADGGRDSQASFSASVASSSGAPSDMTISTLPGLGPPQQPRMRPEQRFAVDVLLEQRVIEHHARSACLQRRQGRVGGLVHDVEQIGEAARIGGRPSAIHCARALPPRQLTGREAENLRLHAAALQHAAQDLGARRCHGDRRAAHRSGVVDQYRDRGGRKFRCALLLERQRLRRVDDHSREPRAIEQPLLPVELPEARLLNLEMSLQPARPARDVGGRVATEAAQLLGQSVAGSWFAKGDSRRPEYRTVR